MMAAPTVRYSDHAEFRWRQRANSKKDIHEAWLDSDPVQITDSEYHGMGRRDPEAGILFIVKNDTVTTVLYEDFVQFHETTEDHWQTTYRETNGTA